MCCTNIISECFNDIFKNLIRLGIEIFRVLIKHSREKTTSNNYQIVKYPDWFDWIKKKKIINNYDQKLKNTCLGIII